MIWKHVVGGLLLAAVGLATLGWTGCAKKQPSGGAALPAAPKSWPAPTEQQGRQFAEALQQAALHNDVAAFNQLLDWDAILDRAMAGVEGAEDAKKGFVTGFKKSLAVKGGLASEMIAATSKGGSFRLLRVHAQGKEQRALFRLLLDEGGVNYYDFVLAQQDGGKARAVDIYVFLSAELSSQTLRRAFLPCVAESSKSFLDRLSGGESDFAKNAGKLKQIADCVRSGQHPQALQIYAQLPPSMKKDKNVLLLRLRAAQAAGDKEYQAALDAFRLHHPNDPCLDMVLIDHYLLRKQFDKARSSIDRLEKAVEGDPYLDVLRADTYFEEKRHDEARKCAQRAADADGTLLPAYWTLVTISLAEKKFDETARLLTTIRDRLGVALGDLATVPEYADFVKSPQYQRWHEEQSKRQEPD